MISERWYAVLESSEVKAGRPLGATRMGVRLVLWRDRAGALQCIADRCVHRGVSLSAGRLSDGNVQCPFHGMEFDGVGRCLKIPADGSAATIPGSYAARSFGVKEAHGLVWLWWGAPRDEYPPIPFFDDLDDSFSWRSVRSLWATHYSRAIENQLDVAHVPFVHASTIGRGGRTLVNGPGCRLEGDSLYVWPYNVKDSGQKPLTPEEVGERKGSTFLHFIYPNIWENHISENLRVFAVFAPVDEESTMMYIRQYQKVVTIPVLKQIFDVFGSVFNRIVANQDKPVVETQLPKRTAMGIGEYLIQADRPILLYRKRRRELGASEQPTS
ncbi:MAG TPA: aromatic ring-hydroxylating dioxygenase subunit alpha [Nitrososphaerales archaeon]|nr:aromatic ring-hydroxylating dioxygenase subunit alpha [Nitrososphaerales archaeon]